MKGEGPFLRSSCLSSMRTNSMRMSLSGPSEDWSSSRSRERSGMWLMLGEIRGKDKS